MKYWQKLFVKTTVWLAAEVLLTLMKLDDLANYSEFIFDQKGILTVSEVAHGLIIA